MAPRRRCSSIGAVWPTTRSSSPPQRTDQHRPRHPSLSVPNFRCARRLPPSPCPRGMMPS
eukprot:6954883-Prymnesium_polylepis.1